jgi:hypothetical protein
MNLVATELLSQERARSARDVERAEQSGYGCFAHCLAAKRVCILGGIMFVLIVADFASKNQSDEEIKNYVKAIDGNIKRMDGRVGSLFRLLEKTSKLKSKLINIAFTFRCRISRGCYHYMKC